MAVLQGGIFSRPAGKTGGIVFGAARTRQGKLVTSRLLVPPSNPNTALQQAQRSKFAECLNVIRRWSPSIYQSDFNRSIGQLPGFQSMESILLNQIDAALTFSFVTPINLGLLHNPASILTHSNDLGNLNFTFSTELGDNGTNNDIAVLIAVSTSSGTRNQTNEVVSYQTALRSAGSISGPASLHALIEYQYYFYFRGAGTAAGLLSVAQPGILTV